MHEALPVMSSKAKRVLPTRPEPPSVEQILADVRSTHPDDPVFLLPTEPHQDHCPSPGFPGRQEVVVEERDRLYRQSRSYVAMNQRLQESQDQLRERREELQQVGVTLERGIAEMRQKAF